MDADEVVAALGLASHPEGGWYAETHRDPAPPGGGGGRGAVTGTAAAPGTAAGDDDAAVTSERYYADLALRLHGILVRNAAPARAAAEAL